MWGKSHAICLFVPGAFHLICSSPVTAVAKMLQFLSFLWMNSVPLCVCTVLFFYPSGRDLAIEFLSLSWLLCLVQHWAWRCSCFTALPLFSLTAYAEWSHWVMKQSYVFVLRSRHILLHHHWFTLSPAVDGVPFSPHPTVLVIFDNNHPCKNEFPSHREFDLHYPVDFF